MLLFLTNMFGNNMLCGNRSLIIIRNIASFVYSSVDFASRLSFICLHLDICKLWDKSSIYFVKLLEESIQSTNQ